MKNNGLTRIFRNIIIIMTALIAAVAAEGADFADHTVFHIQHSGLFQYESEDFIADLLMPLSEDDPLYTGFNSEQTRIPEGSELARYNENGFRSLTAHYKGAHSSNMISVSEIRMGTEFYEGRELDDARLDLCVRYDRARIVIADRDGNILHISDEVKLSKAKKFYTGYFIYDTDTGVVECTYHEKYEVGKRFDRLLSAMELAAKICAALSVALFIFYLAKGSLMAGPAIFTALSFLLTLPFWVGMGTVAFRYPFMYDSAKAWTDIMAVFRRFLLGDWAAVSILIFAVLLIIAIVYRIENPRKSSPKSSKEN